MGMLLITATSGYLVSSFYSGRLIARFGVGHLLTASCALTGLALISYTLVPQWWMMVLLGIAAGLGAGAIDAGLNTYVAAHFNDGMMQWLHASYGIGVTLGPIIMTMALTTLNSWRTGYRIVGGFQLLLAACFVLTLRLWSRNERHSESEQTRKLTDFNSPLRVTLKQGGVWLSMLLFFLYTGAEVTLGAWAYTLLTGARGVPIQAAGLWAGSYWATFTIGRILAGLYTKWVGIKFIVTGSLAGALAGAVLLWWNPTDWVSLLAVAMIGLAIAPIFPALVSGTSQRVGVRFTANTIGMQMAAAGLGAAFIPGLVGVLARRVDLEVIPVCLAVLFALLLGFNSLAGKRKDADIKSLST
jgi:fucose permease